MWKTFFDFCYFWSYFIPKREWRESYRVNKLFDYRHKLKVLCESCPDIKIKNIRMIKGGWNIGFIINNKYVFKIRKKFDETRIPKIIKEKRMTDAFQELVPLAIPKIEVITSGGYTFYRYNFIPGHNMNTFSFRTIMKHRTVWAKQLAEFIFAMHHASPIGIDDLKTDQGDGWHHNDICNNTVVDTKTMKIRGIIDWEYSGWNFLETEFRNCTHWSSKLRKSGMEQLIRDEYEKLEKTHK